MIHVTVLYPNGPGATFDMSYYTGKHLPMVRAKCGPACRAVQAELGVGAGEPGSKPPYIAIGRLVFDSVEAFQSAFAPHAGEILADVPNYTNTRPVVQIGELKT
jgi:uncharacterized protein (TIGR02118 family)